MKKTSHNGLADLAIGILAVAAAALLGRLVAHARLKRDNGANPYLTDSPQLLCFLHH